MWPSGVLCTLQFLWIINLSNLQSSLMAITEIHLTIVMRTTQVRLATTLAPAGEVSGGACHCVMGPGKCCRHYQPIASLSTGRDRHTTSTHMQARQALTEPRTGSPHHSPPTPEGVRLSSSSILNAKLVFSITTKIHLSQVNRNYIYQSSTLVYEF